MSWSAGYTRKGPSSASMASTKACTYVSFTLNKSACNDDPPAGLYVCPGLEQLGACRCLLVAVLAASAVFPGKAQLGNPKIARPSTPITSYSQYLDAAGQALGVLPVQPEAEHPLAAHVPAAGPRASAHMAPMSAPAGGRKLTIHELAISILYSRHSE